LRSGGDGDLISCTEQFHVESSRLVVYRKGSFPRIYSSESFSPLEALFRPPHNRTLVLTRSRTCSWDICFCLKSDRLCLRLRRL
jgi:hypothetical protein